MKSVLLVITAICSQLVSWGFILMAVSLVFGGWTLVGGGTPGYMERAIFFLILSIGGCVFLGICLGARENFNFNWRGLLAGIFVAPLGYFILSMTVNDTLLGQPREIIAPGVMIMTLLLASRVKSLKDFAGSLSGVIVGNILSAITLALINKMYLQFVLTFPWSWLCAVFFPDLLQKRVEKKDVAVWVALMVISPFFVDAIYKWAYGIR